ncbi:hypothetical protein [Flavilitoribacter nigricans]|uniref:Uncharacterized protein n=1 Tax=Flavilitoribacter nigricans (strain ATCC 23147 / DSM 23189 / NBRC 102662 / NCIMB 1420 / SS-2) TaxID=1122177 RepID=A0A2D0N117_FLAN2|nr:hypothetical protein [Flavilitoribacter nigricans]PHN02242.1 hypothetical protein CRP01_33450 [Flavilitoribacter nigricans DSM 23189 = NBRC 102662]
MKSYILFIVVVLAFGLSSGCENECGAKSVGADRVAIIFSETPQQLPVFLSTYGTTIQPLLHNFIEEGTFFSERLQIPRLHFFSLSDNTEGAERLATASLSQEEAKACCYSDENIETILSDFKDAVKNKYQTYNEGIRVLPSLKRLEEVARGLPDSSLIEVHYFSDMLETIADNGNCGTYCFLQKGSRLINNHDLSRAESDLNGGCLEDRYITPAKNALEKYTVKVVIHPLNGGNNVQVGYNGESYQLIRDFWRNYFAAAGILDITFQ